MGTIGGASRDFFTVDPKARPVWGTLAGADLKTHQNELGEAALAPGGVFALEKAAEPAKDAPVDETAAAETEAEREERELAEKEKVAAREREEQEVREQEKREKKERRERKRKEREVGHAIVEATATAAHPKDKYTRAYHSFCLSFRVLRRLYSRYW